MIVERRSLTHRRSLEDKMEDAFAVISEERSAAQSKARVASVLAILKAEPQAVQEGIMAGLKAMLGKQYAKPSTGLQKRPGSGRAVDAAEALFKTGKAA
jgi:hypothetical protein